ncbi:MAG: tRNA (adenosine(37)-N6)-dimethylallyltransferase MiaA [Gammaproteobacteria bacterium]|nr:tRNA (adenosine(37)-N6)-dimethylallyltransferase MiaA [Gammaproteobacteria bacterium]
MNDIDAILLAGPTASGKTDLVITLAERAPIEIVSVDSTQVYRGLDIGSAKPDAATRSRVPHHLIDIREPCEPYSAGEFVNDAIAAIGDIRARGRMPVFVGGTMLYFNALVHGIAPLPAADPAIRRRIDERARAIGWPALHAELAKVDPAAAARVHPNDPQRIQRALEVHEASGRPISDWQRHTTPTTGLRFRCDALVPTDRTILHDRIQQRFLKMMSAGFLTEVEKLRARPDIDDCRGAMRSVGYRQLSGHLAGEYDLQEAIRRGTAAARQLARRQLTWIRADASWRLWEPFDHETRERWIAETATMCRAPGRGTRPMVAWSTVGVI